MTPTPQQASILRAASGDDNLMIIARAGCGKTSTLCLMSQELPRRPTLALAFNKKIQEELKTRLPPWIDTKTINGLGHLSWKSMLGYFPEIDAKKAWTDIDAILHQQGVRLSQAERSDLKTLYDGAKQLGWVPHGCMGTPIPVLRDDAVGADELFDWCDVEPSNTLLVLLRACLIKSIRDSYTGVIDFNDQIYMPVCFQASVPRYHTVLVDEAQDLSKLNHRLISKACSSRLIVVGDPAQAIYAFRGASTSSMEDLKEKRSFVELPLTVTFRCAKAIVARQKDFVADFEAAEANIEGEVWDWTVHEKEFIPWDHTSLPPLAAIICRNNAPLFSLAFKLIKRGRGVQMLGTDIGRALRTRLDNATKGVDPQAKSSDIQARIEKWFATEIAKAKGQRRKASLRDTLECLQAILEGTETLAQARKACSDLFEDRKNVVTLASIHKAKGLEWDWVMHLDPWRIPSPYAESDEDLAQEYNAKYVAETRPRETLVLANLEDFQ